MSNVPNPFLLLLKTRISCFIQTLSLRFLQSALTLSSIILFDTLVSEFEICDPHIEDMDTKKKSKLHVIERAQQGIGLKFDQKIGINETVLVKV